MNIKSKVLDIQNNLAERSKKSAFTYAKRMAFYRKLERMTGEPAAVPINEALMELQALEEIKGRRSSMWYMLDDVMVQLRSTKDSFTTCLSKYIPENDQMVLAAAERDDITLGFKALIDSNKKSRIMKQAFISAVSYPLFLVVMIILVVTGFSIWIIPQYAEMITAETKLSTASMALIAISHYLPIWLPLIVGSMVSLAIFIIWALPNLNKYRLKLENLPPFNMYRIMTGGAFIFALNSLSKAGYAPQEALGEMRDSVKPYLRHRIDVYLELMADGKDLGEVLYESQLNFPDEEMVKELSIQTKYSDEDNSLEILSEVLHEDGLEVIKKQAKTINTIITLAVMITIAMLYIGVLLLGQDVGSMNNSSTF